MMACVLAAGRGVRLSSPELPKGFLDLGFGPIIVRSLALLRAAGVEQIVIVTGFAAHHYEALEGVVCVHNPRFLETGTLASLACARPLLRGPVLLVESDLVYEPRALEPLVNNPHDQVLVSGPTQAGDEVWVEAPHGELVAMSKEASRLRSVLGEFVGLSRLSADLLAVLPPDGSYDEDGLSGRAGIAATLIPDLVWGEIDDARHLERVRQLKL